MYPLRKEIVILNNFYKYHIFMIINTVKYIKKFRLKIK